MITIREIYNGAENLINQIIRKESAAQGHYLTGGLENSLTAEFDREGTADVMQGVAVYYAQFVNDGVPASSTSMKQFPFLVKYFQLRGLGEKEAKGAAAATIKVWQKQGMPTQASKRFSQTGSRVQMFQNAFVGNAVKIDDYMSASLDFGVSEKFQETKSETI